MTREEAIKICKQVRKYFNGGKLATDDTDAIYGALTEAIEALQQKTGKWIHREDMDFIDQNKVQHIHLMCENCGLIHDFFDGHTGQYKFCPNCGASMRGEDKE